MADFATAIAAVLADQLLENPTADQREEIRKRLMVAIDLIDDGVYFDLPDSIYHGVPRLSASGLQKLCISPATYWKGSHLDPNRPELDEESSKAQILGKAYHCARLEPDVFHSRYIRKPSKDELPVGSLTTEAAIKATLKELGEPETKKEDGGVLGKARRLQEVLADILGNLNEESPSWKIAQRLNVPIWHVVEAEWEAERNGRIGIPGDLWDDLIIDMERIQANEDIAPLLSGGFAEVSIFWTDAHGLKRKARIDYLRATDFSDVKTYANSKGMDVEQCIANAFRYGRYHVQWKTYLDATEAVRIGGLEIQHCTTESQRELIAAIKARLSELGAHYIFQEKGIPNLFDYEIPAFNVPANNKVNDAGATPEQIAAVERATRTKTGLHMRAIKDIDKALRDFTLYSQVYPAGEAWQPIDPQKRMGDELFNPRWLEGEF